ncbi:MAG: hypothetical protein ACLSFZ_03050 [Frisingicoccus sp.]
MLTQSQIDAIAEAVLQSMRPASTPEKNKPFSVGGHHRRIPERRPVIWREQRCTVGVRKIRTGRWKPLRSFRWTHPL